MHGELVSSCNRAQNDHGDEDDNSSVMMVFHRLVGGGNYANAVVGATKLQRERTVGEEGSTQL